MHLHCCHGVCKSDSRKPEAGVTFMPFPKPGSNLKIAKRWVHLCARKEFTIKSINRFTYICSKHFHPGEILDIKANPNLEPFNARKRIRTHHFAKNTRTIRPSSNTSTIRHSSNNSFDCDKCDYKTKRRCNFNRHQREVHNNGKVLQCEDCKYEAGSKKSFETHMWRIHKKGDLLKCQHCDFASPHSSQLKYHIET